MCSETAHAAFDKAGFYYNIEIRKIPITKDFMGDFDAMKKAVDKKFNLVVWPKSLDIKDINDMIIKGKTAIEIQSLISSSTYCGLEALQQINDWKKV